VREKKREKERGYVYVYDLDAIREFAKRFRSESNGEAGIEKLRIKETKREREKEREKGQAAVR